MTSKGSQKRARRARKASKARQEARKKAEQRFIDLAANIVRQYHEEPLKGFDYSDDVANAMADFLFSDGYDSRF